MSLEPPPTARTRADDPAAKPAAVESANVPAVGRQVPAEMMATPWTQTLEATRPDATATENRAFNDFYYWRTPEADIDVRALLREANGL